MRSKMLFTTMYHEQKNATMFMFKLNNLPTAIGVYTGVSALEGNIKGLTYAVQEAMDRIGGNDLEIHCDTPDVMKYASGKFKPFSQVARNFVNYLNKQRGNREIEVIDDLTAEQASQLKREAKQNKDNAVYPERQQREVKSRAFEHSYVPASTATTDHFAASLDVATVDCPFIDSDGKKWCMVQGVDVPVRITDEKGFSATIEEATMERPYVDKDGRKFCTMEGINMPIEIIDEEPNEEVFPFKVTVFEPDGQTIKCSYNQDDFGARCDLYYPHSYTSALRDAAYFADWYEQVEKLKVVREGDDLIALKGKNDFSNYKGQSYTIQDYDHGRYLKVSNGEVVCDKNMRVVVDENGKKQLVDDPSLPLTDWQKEHQAQAQQPVSSQQYVSADEQAAMEFASSQPAKKSFSLSGKKTTEASSTPPVRSGGFSLAGKKVSQPSGAMPVPASSLTRPTPAAPLMPEKTAKQIKKEQEEEERRRQEEENSKYQQMSFADFGYSGFY